MAQNATDIEAWKWIFNDNIRHTAATHAKKKRSDCRQVQMEVEVQKLRFKESGWRLLVGKYIGLPDAPKYNIQQIKNILPSEK